MTPSTNHAAKELTQLERSQVVSAMLVRSRDGVPKRGAFKEVAQLFQVHPITVTRVWRRAKDNASITGVYKADSMKGQTGRSQHDLSADLARLRCVPPERRTTIRAAAAASGIPRSTLHRRLKRGELRAATSTTKPLLSAENKERRLSFCLDHVDPSCHAFKDMMDVIHVDEKWFYLTQIKKKFYLLADEPTPDRALKSKRNITKVMMLAAVARPRCDEETGQQFQGKLGIWLFVERSPAKRSSRNRPAGTLVTKSVSVNTASYRRMLMDKVLPMITVRWPKHGHGMRLVIQQDNASPHIANDDQEFQAAVQQRGLDVRLRFQPPNSPDLNVLDLGVFNAIQARQQCKGARTLDELVEATIDAFWELPPATIDHAFLSLQGAMDSCIGAGGSNSYRLRHIGKARLTREGRLPLSISCSEATIGRLGTLYNNS